MLTFVSENWRDCVTASLVNDRAYEKDTTVVLSIKEAVRKTRAS